MTSFIPDLKAPQTTIPFFEDSAEIKIPGRGTEKEVSRLKAEVVDLLTKLGAFSVSFTPGTLVLNPQRYGFRIEFRYGSGRGRIDIAALPLRSDSPHKKDRALAQALYLFRDKLEATVYASIYEPGGVPLVPYLIGDSGETVTESLIKAGNLPLLNSGA